jgi:hypothetical protein
MLRIERRAAAAKAQNYFSTWKAAHMEAEFTLEGQRP